MHTNIDMLAPDFHCALLWLRALEICVGHDPTLLMSELEGVGLFAFYRSPFKA
jgi:hypothetical protein